MRSHDKGSTATAEVILAVLRAMAPKQRRAVIAGIAEQDDLRKDLLDLAVIADRRHESSRPLRQYLAEKSK
jgi:hypothetical protein